MKISNMPTTERPREKLLYSNPSALSTSELLAIIIRTGNRDKSAVQLAEDVVSYSTELDGLGNADAKELAKLNGIGPSKACSIVASIELGRRVLQPRRDERYVIRGAADAAALLINELKFEKREHLVVLLLNSKSEVESKHVISIGELANAPVHPREGFSPAVRKGSAGIIVVHNHPSGDTTPSGQDIDVTLRLREGGELLGIPLLDHIIIGGDYYLSLRTSNFIEDWK